MIGKDHVISGSLAGQWPQLGVPCSHLGPWKKQKKGSSPKAKQNIQALGMPDPAEVLSSGVSQGEQGGYASSCSSVGEEGGEQMSDVVHDLEEEVQRLHHQVPCTFIVTKYASAMLINSGLCN